MSTSENVPDEFLDDEPKPTYEQYLATVLDGIARYQAGTMDVDEIYSLITEVSSESVKVISAMSRHYFDKLKIEYAGGAGIKDKLAKVEKKIDELECQMRELQTKELLIRDKSLGELNLVANNTYATTKQLRYGYGASYDSLMAVLGDVKEQIQLIEQDIIDIWSLYPVVGVASDSAKMTHDSEKFQIELKLRAKKAQLLAGYKEIVDLASVVKRAAMKDEKTRVADSDKVVARNLSNKVYATSTAVNTYKRKNIQDEIDLGERLLGPLYNSRAQLKRDEGNRDAETEKIRFDTTIEIIKERLLLAIAKHQSRL